MAGAISQDRESCQFLFCLMLNLRWLEVPRWSGAGHAEALVEERAVHPRIFISWLYRNSQQRLAHTAERQTVIYAGSVLTHIGDLIDSWLRELRKILSLTESSM